MLERVKTTNDGSQIFPYFDFSGLTNEIPDWSGQSDKSLFCYPDRDTFEFDQGQVTKNQPITILGLQSESLGI